MVSQTVVEGMAIFVSFFTGLNNFKREPNDSTNAGSELYFAIADQ